MTRFPTSLRILLLLLSIVVIVSEVHAAPAEKQVLKAMRKATEYMDRNHSNRGGYLWYYAADLSE